MQTTLNKRQEMEAKIISKLCRTHSEDVLEAIVRENVINSGTEGIKKIEGIRITPPPKQEIEALVEKQVGWNFDDIHIAASIKNAFPGWSEDQVDDELDRLELMYEAEYQKKIDTVWETIQKECQRIENVLNQEILELKDRIRNSL